jgi:hypothetical protein
MERFFISQGVFICETINSGTWTNMGLDLNKSDLATTNLICLNHYFLKTKA